MTDTRSAEHEIGDVALAQAAVLGQAWAQRALWFRFAPMVYSLLRRTLGARQDPEDLLQEVFLRVYCRLDSLENPAALRSFIYSFALRVVSEELRRYRVRSRLAVLFHAGAEAPFTPHVDFEARELLGRIQAVMDRMQPRHRAVFVLRRFEGMELTQVAASLDVSLATVKRDLGKANAFVARAIQRDERLRAGLAAPATRVELEEGT
jgi:RNA polymerase sigma-70 factor (ECF subfamily)